MKGFDSTAPKYNTPMTVVKQSREPKRVNIKKLGNTSDFNAQYIEAFSFPLLLLPSQNIVSCQCLRTKLPKSIYSKLKSKKLFFKENHNIQVNNVLRKDKHNCNNCYCSDHERYANWHFEQCLEDVIVRSLVLLHEKIKWNVLLLLICNHNSLCIL